MGRKHKKDKKKKSHHHHRSDSSNSHKSDNYDLFSNSEDAKSEDNDSFLEGLDIHDKNKKNRDKPVDISSESTVEPNESTKEVHNFRVSELIRNADNIIGKTPQADEELNSSSSNSKDKHKSEDSEEESVGELEKVNKKKKKYKDVSPLNSTLLQSSDTSEPIAISSESTDETNKPNKDKSDHRVSELIRNADNLVGRVPLPEEDLNSSSSSHSKEKHKSSESMKSEEDSNDESIDELEKNKKKEKKKKKSITTDVISESTEEVDNLHVSQLIRNADNIMSKTPLPDEEINSKEKEKEKHKKHKKHKNKDSDDSGNDESSSTTSFTSFTSSKEKEKEKEDNIPIPSARKRPQSARHYQNMQPINNNNIIGDNLLPPPPSQQQQQQKNNKETLSQNSDPFSNPSFSGSSSQYEDIPLIGNNNNNNFRSNSFHSNNSKRSSKSLKESEQLTLPENKAEILQSNPALNSEIEQQQPVEPSSRRPVSFHRSVVISEKSENSVKELSSKNENLIQRAYESERTNQISSLRSMESVNPLIRTTLDDSTKWKFEIFRKKLGKKDNNINNNNNNEYKNDDNYGDDEEESKLNRVYAPLKETSAKKNLYYDKMSKPQIRIPPRGTVAYVHYMKSIKCTCRTAKLKSLCTIEHPCKGCARATALYGMNIEREGCSYNPVTTHIETNSGGGNDYSDNFIKRQDNYVKTRRKEKMKRIGEAEYNSGIIKECPKCKRPQSYESYASGKNLCENCHKKFQFPRGWNNVKEEFWKRNDDFIKRKNDKRVVERDVYDYKYGVTYYCRVCKKTQSLNEYMNHQMRCPLGHPYIPQYSNYEINDEEEEEEKEGKEEKIDRIQTARS